MLNFSSFWLNYFEYCQRSWLDMARLWMPSLPTTFFGAREDGGGGFGAGSGFGANHFGADWGTGFGANSDHFGSGASGLLNALSSGSWLSALTPWMPRVEANIEPFVTDVSASTHGLAEAARISMRIFMPWGGEPFWVEALVGQHKPKSFAPQAHHVSITESVVHEVAARGSSKSGKDV